MAIHQLVATFNTGDAVGNHMLNVQRVLRDAGFESEIFAEFTALGARVKARHYSSLGRRARKGDVLVYQYAIGSKVADWVRSRSEAIVVNHHNTTPSEFFAPWDTEIIHGLEWGRRQLQQLATSGAAGLAVSAYNEEELRRVGFLRTGVAPILLDLAEYDAAPAAETVARLRAERTGTELLFVGRVAPNKCHHDLLAAFAAYRRTYDAGARLRLVGARGTARYDAALDELAADLGIADAVTFTGGVPFGELLAHYRHADALVCLSEHEGFCVPLVEAMHLDLPVVAFASSAVPETMAGAGLLLDAKDPFTVAAAIDRAVNDAAVREAMVAAGRVRAAELDLPVTGPRFVEAVTALGGLR